MAGLDTFFMTAPAAARGARQGFTDIRNTLADVEAIDQQYRNNDERRLLQQGLSVPGGSTMIEPRAGLALPTNPLDLASNPLPGSGLPTYEVPAQPAPVTQAAPSGTKVKPPVVTGPDSTTSSSAPTAGLLRPTAELVKLPTEQLSVAEFQALPPAERARRVQAENQRRQAAIDRASLASAPAAASDVLVGGPLNAISQGGTWLANQIGIPRVGRALGIYDPDVTRVEIPTIGSGTATPYYDMIRQVVAENQPVTEAQFIENLRKAESTERAKNLQAATKEGYADWQLNAKGKPIRGLINNNPGNIRFTPNINWAGATGQQGGFVAFETPEAGIRAMATNLLTYSSQYNLNTVQGIINRWAPPKENNTKGYIDKVSTALGVKPNEQIDVRDPATMQSLVAAIIQVENGKQPYPVETIQAGINYALNPKTAPAGSTAVATAPAGRTQNIQVDNTGKTVARPADDKMPSLPEVVVTADREQPAPAQQPSQQAVRDEALNQTRRALTMSPEQHNFEVQKILRERQMAVQLYERAKGDAYSVYQEEFNNLNARRQMLATQAEAARRVGNVKTAATYLDQINTLDGQINRAKYNYFTAVNQADSAIQGGLDGIDNNLSLALAYQGLNDLQYRNDPTRLERMWSRFAGYEVRIQPRSDGQFNLWVPVGGQLAPAGVYSKENLSQEAMVNILPAWRQKVSDTQAAVKSKLFDAQLDVWKTTQGEMAKTLGALKVEEVRGNVELIKKRIDAAGFDAPKELAGPNGPVLVAISKDGSSIMEIDVNPAAADKDGKFKREAIRVRPNPARAGLNTANAQ